MKTKKELKEEYKQKKYKMGLFQIRNKTNNKIYLDCSMDLVAIWNRNRVQLNSGTHSNEQLQKDWKELGEENFAYEIVSEIEQKDDGKPNDYNKEIKELLSMYLEELAPYDEKGYNKKPGL